MMRTFKSCFIVGKEKLWKLLLIHRGNCAECFVDSSEGKKEGKKQQQEWLIFLMNNLKYTNEYLYKGKRTRRKRNSIIHDLCFFTATQGPAEKAPRTAEAFFVQFSLLNHFSCFLRWKLASRWIRASRIHPSPHHSLAYFEILISSLLVYGSWKCGTRKIPNGIISAFFGISPQQCCLFFVLPFIKLSRCVH